MGNQTQKETLGLNSRAVFMITAEQFLGTNVQYPGEIISLSKGLVKVYQKC